MSFVHLHTHTTFSFGDGACRIPEVVARAAELGMPALAVTDHEGLYGAVRFYQACKAAGIKPIVGVELTVEPAVGPGGRAWEPGADDGPPGDAAAIVADPAAAAALAPDGRIAHLKAAATVPPAAARASGAGGYHLVLLAKDYAGWSNLCRIISAAHLEHPGEPPVARLATLAEHGGHLVALSGCRRGEVWSRLLAGDKAGARAAASVFHGIFGRDYFIELQHELLPDSGASLRALDLLAHELRLPTVATGDVHYTVKADAGLHDVLAAEAANQPLPNPLGRKNAELYLKTPSQMRRLFQRYPEAYANAERIAARCNLDLGLGRLLFPAYPLPPGETAVLAALEALLRGRRRALPAAHRRGHGAARARAQGHRGARLRRVLPRRARHRRVRAGPRHLLLGPRLRRQQHRQLRAGHHRRRPHRPRPALRALPQPGAPPDARHRHRLLLGAPRRGHRLHLRALRPRPGRDGGHRQHDARAVGGAHRQPRVRVHAGRDQRPLPARPLGQRGQAPGGARRAPRARRPRVPAAALPPPGRRRRAALGVPRPPGHAPGRVHHHARPAHRPRAAAVGGQGRRGGAVRQGRHRDAGPRQDGHPGAQDALGDRRGGAAHRGAHRRARAAPGSSRATTPRSTS